MKLNVSAVFTNVIYVVKSYAVYLCNVLNYITLNSLLVHCLFCTQTNLRKLVFWPYTSSFPSNWLTFNLIRLYLLKIYRVQWFLELIRLHDYWRIQTWFPLLCLLLLKLNCLRIYILSIGVCHLFELNGRILFIVTCWPGNILILSSCGRYYNWTCNWLSTFAVSNTCNVLLGYWVSYWWCHVLQGSSRVLCICWLSGWLPCETEHISKVFSKLARTRNAASCHIISCCVGRTCIQIIFIVTWRCACKLARLLLSWIFLSLNIVSH